MIRNMGEISTTPSKVAWKSHTNTESRERSSEPGYLPAYSTGTEAQGNLRDREERQKRQWKKKGRRGNSA